MPFAQFFRSVVAPPALLVVLFSAPLFGQLDLNFNRSEWVVPRDVFERNVTMDGQGPIFRDPVNPEAPADYNEVVYQAAIEAGTAAGPPVDSPTLRIDPNGATGIYKGVGSLELTHPTLGTFVCTGSVIDDEYVLTAAHCFDLDSDGVVDAGIVSGSSFHLNDLPGVPGTPSSTTAISSATIHPDFAGFSTGGANDDLAVVKLAAAVPAGTTKYMLRTTGMSSGEVLELAGYGVSGFGDIPGVAVLPEFTKKRAGKNEADLFVGDDEGVTSDEIFLYDFDGPTGIGILGGATLGNAIETTIRPGDSGGPAFIDMGGMKVIAGVNTFEFSLPSSTAPPGVFGVLGGGLIITPEYFAWIKSIAPGAEMKPVPEPSSILMLLCGSVLMMAQRRSRRS